MVVMEVKAGKLEEALTLAGKGQAMFRGIEGYESSIVLCRNCRKTGE